MPRRVKSNCVFHAPEMRKRRFTMKTFLIIGAALSLCAAHAEQLAATPPMGWNSWNWHGKGGINETVVRETIDAMVGKGLRDAGYEYVVVDGGWRDTKLSLADELVAHPGKFPNGIKPLADYAHSKGLKFGLHTVPGSHDCGGDPVGAYGIEEIHIGQFADWGLDFVKLDKCRFDEGWDEALVESVYRKWGRLLKEQDRDILFSISAYRYRKWYPEVCNMARTTYDISARVTGGAVFSEPWCSSRNFWSVMGVAELNNQVADFAGPGYWNDPDMMVTGNQGLTLEEQKTHFALWCIMSSPLFLGSDPRTMTDEELELVTNKEAIAINQDPREQGRRIGGASDSQVWAKKRSDGSVAVLLLNRSDSDAKSVTFHPQSVGLKGICVARDVYSGADLGEFDGVINRKILPHGCLFMSVRLK
jgi:alpha-galactosidase